MGTYIQQLEHRMKETWNQHLQVERGNPVRTFSGTDFKTNYQDKSYKKQRNILKQNLKNYSNDLN